MLLLNNKNVGNISPLLRNILAVIAGLVIGSIVNGAIVALGHSLFLVVGVNLNNPDELAAAIKDFTIPQFLMPFFAHALGTLVGAIIAAKIGFISQKYLALIVGIIFLISGISMIYIVPLPLWCTLLDLIVAYIPMALLGW